MSRYLAETHTKVSQWKDQPSSCIALLNLLCRRKDKAIQANQSQTHYGTLYGAATHTVWKAEFSHRVHSGPGAPYWGVIRGFQAPVNDRGSKPFLCFFSCFFFIMDRYLSYLCYISCPNPCLVPYSTDAVSGCLLILIQLQNQSYWSGRRRWAALGLMA